MKLFGLARFKVAGLRIKLQQARGGFASAARDLAQAGPLGGSQQAGRSSELPQSNPTKCSAISAGSPLSSPADRARLIISRKAARLGSTPREFRAWATSGARTASAIASRNTAMTVGSEISRKQLGSQGFERARQRFPIMRFGQAGGHLQPLGALADAGRQHFLFAADQRVELAFRNPRPGRDLQRRGLGKAALHERREGRIEDALARRGFVGLLARAVLPSSSPPSNLP